MEGQGKVIGRRAEDFSLMDQDGGVFTLSKEFPVQPLLLVFYPGDFTMVCTKQLCDYRDNLGDIANLGVRLVGISKNSVLEHAQFAGRYSFPFKLLSDPQNKVAKIYGCTSLLMLGTVSRAVFIINQQGLVLYRFVEPTTLTRKTAQELVGILGDLRSNKLL
jgi:peroxiredoxin Q/BCP